MPLRIGARLSSYEILAPLGAGGMGEVYRARDTQLQRDVTLKVVLVRGVEAARAGQMKRLNPAPIADARRCCLVAP